MSLDFWRQIFARIFVSTLFVQKLQHSMNYNDLGYLTNINLFWNLICSKRDASIEMKQWANIFKEVHSLEKTCDGVLLSAVAGMRTDSFTKNDFITDAFLWKLWGFTENNFQRKLLVDCIWLRGTFWTYWLFYQQKINQLSRTSRNSCSQVIHSVCLENL